MLRIDPVNFSNLIVVSGNLSSINFTGVPGAIGGSIVGRVTQGGLPLQGVSVQAMVGTVTIASGASDSDGYYSIDNLGYDTYTIVPTSPGYTFFFPASLTNVYAGTSDNDFTAIGVRIPGHQLTDREPANRPQLPLQRHVVGCMYWLSSFKLSVGCFERKRACELQHK